MALVSASDEADARGGRSARPHASRRQGEGWRVAQPAAAPPRQAHRQSRRVGCADAEAAHEQVARPDHRHRPQRHQHHVRARSTTSGCTSPGPYLGANESNPKGFFESKWAVKFHKQITVAARINDFDSRPAAFELAQAAITDELREPARRLPDRGERRARPGRRQGPALGLGPGPLARRRGRGRPRDPLRLDAAPPRRGGRQPLHVLRQPERRGQAPQLRDVQRRPAGSTPR